MGFFRWLKKKDKEENISVEIMAAKQDFLERVKPYQDENMLRMVYSGNHFAICALGELTYVVFPYMLSSEGPIGMYTSHGMFEKLVARERYVYALFKELMKDVKRYADIIYDLSLDNMDYWRKWINKKQKEVTSNIDLELESKLLKK